MKKSRYIALGICFTAGAALCVPAAIRISNAAENAQARVHEAESFASMDADKATVMIDLQPMP